MKFFLYAILFIGTSFLTAQDMRSLEDFHEVSAATGVKVILVKSSDTRAKVEVENCDLSDVITEVRSGRLIVKFDDNLSWGRTNRNRKATITVYYKDLEGISVSSGANIRANNAIEANELDLDGSSGGIMELKVASNVLTADASSGGILKITGSTASLDVDVSSGGIFKGYDLKSETADADASSGGVATFSVSKILSADASSGGSIRYRGNPDKIRSNSSVAGSIREDN